MKKLLFILLSVFTLSAANARTVDVTAAYTGASHFDQVEAEATAALSLNALAGVKAKYVKDKHVEPEGFKNPIYSVYLPVHLDFELLQINLTPFYYFKNKSENNPYQDASAFGLKTLFVMNLQDDTVNDLYTNAFIGASFARQKGTAFFDEGDVSDQYYSQAAYTLGFYKDFFRSFGFQASATAFHYPDGVSDVAGFRGVLNQQDLAEAQTLDITRELGKYTLNARLTRMWPDNASTIYLGYAFGEYHTADPQHSFMVGNSFVLAQRISVDMAYNHIRTVHNENKRDIFYVRLGMSF